MRILITNDDGIQADSLRVLVEWATKIGDVTVYAPKYQQSAKSHAIELRTAFEVKEVEYPVPVRAVSVDSTPADCVRVAVCGFNEKYDLVLSGINNGYNIGEDIVYSGTCAAIFEAANQFIPAIAVSSDVNKHEYAASQLDKVYDYFARHELMKKHSLYNVNVSAQGDKGIVITHQGGAFYRDHYKKMPDGLYMADGYLAYRYENDLTLDTDAVMCGYTSITPLTVDRTDRAIYRMLTE